MPEPFLANLAVAAQSPLALVAYVTVVIAWGLNAWYSIRPQQKAKEILSLYSSDEERNRALSALLDAQPPKGIKRDEIMAWVAMQGSQHKRVVLMIAYLATLFAGVLIVAMALFFPDHIESKRPPQLIDSQVIRPQKP
jgi:hypothetical protein